MAVTSTYAPTVYALVGRNAGPFETVWVFGGYTEVRPSLDLNDGQGPRPLQVLSEWNINAPNSPTLGAPVTLTGALVPAAGWPPGATLTLARVTPPGQPTSFNDAQAFQPTATEAALDHLALQIQELAALRDAVVALSSALPARVQALLIAGGYLQLDRGTGA